MNAAALTVMASFLAVLLALVTLAFIQLRDRHRAARHTLNRVRQERNEARWKLARLQRDGN